MLRLCARSESARIQFPRHHVGSGTDSGRASFGSDGMTRGGTATNCVVPHAVSDSDSSSEIVSIDGARRVLCSGFMEVVRLFGVRFRRLDGLGRRSGLSRRDDRREGCALDRCIMEPEPHEHCGHDDQDADYLSLPARDERRHVRPS